MKFPTDTTVCVDKVLLLLNHDWHSRNNQEYGGWGKNRFFKIIFQEKEILQNKLIWVEEW